MVDRVLATGPLAFLTVLAALAPFPAAAEGSVSTLTLDSLSYISFQDEEVLLLAPGSTIRFHFGTPNPDGSLPFTIGPSDVSIPPVPVPGTEKTLDYALAAPATGTLVATSTGAKIEFEARVLATLNGPNGSGSFTYAMPFSTETASASNATRTETLAVSGLRVVDGARYVQLVGATVNRTNAYPKPGTAVYSVLSGTFDRLP